MLSILHIYKYNEGSRNLKNVLLLFYLEFFNIVIFLQKFCASFYRNTAKTFKQTFGYYGLNNYGVEYNWSWLRR